MIKATGWTSTFALLIFVQTKKDWLVGLGQEGLAWGWGGLSKISQKGWNRKEGRRHKDLKSGASGCQGVGALKKGGWNSGTPLRTLWRDKWNIPVNLQLATCQHPSHPIYYGMYVLPLVYSKSPTSANYVSCYLIFCYLCIYLSKNNAKEVSVW